MEKVVWQNLSVDCSGRKEFCVFFMFDGLSTELLCCGRDNLNQASVKADESKYSGFLTNLFFSDQAVRPNSEKYKEFRQVISSLIQQKESRLRRLFLSFKAFVFNF